MNSEQRLVVLVDAQFLKGRQSFTGWITRACHEVEPLLVRLHGKQQPTDETLRHYMHHPYTSVRHFAACKILGVNSAYLGKKSPGGKLRMALAQEMLAHPSARVRSEPRRCP